MPTHETMETLASGAESEARAAEALAAGRLVVAPTETVYGVFAADRAALAPLVGEETARAAAWHAPDVPTLLAGVGEISAVQRRLIGRLLPGPITVVAGQQAARVPDDASCHRVLRLAADGGAARVAGAMLPFGEGRRIDGLDAEALERLAAAGVALMLDGGPTRLGAPSTVIRLTDTGYELVREGAIEARYLEKLATRTVLFVCTGNTCRSPMAAAIARDLLAGDPFTRVESAGLSAGGGAPMTPEARAALRSIGVAPGSHRSSPLTEAALARADHVYAMTADHLAALGSPRAELLDPEGADVPDPIGGPQDVYDETCRRIRDLVRRRLEALDPAPAAQPGPGGPS